MMNSDKVRLQKRHIVGWLIMGIVVLVLFVVSYVFADPRPALDSELITAFLFAPFSMIVIGFGCFIVEGVFIEKLRFSEVQHPHWFWYVYPVSFIWMVCIAIFLGFIINMFTSKK